MNEHQELSWAEIKEMFAETGRRLKETEQLIKEYAQQRLKEEEKREKEEEKREKEEEKREKEARKREKEIDKRYAYLEKLVGGIGNSNGEMAENFFFNAFRKDKIFMNEKYDRIRRNYFSSADPYKGELDIVLFNGTSVAIIEVKYNAKKENIDIETLYKRVEWFREIEPAYKNHKIYLAVAAMSFKYGLATKLQKAGIVTIHPVGKKMVIYDENVKAF